MLVIDLGCDSHAPPLGGEDTEMAWIGYVFPPQVHNHTFMGMYECLDSPLVCSAILSKRNMG